MKKNVIILEYTHEYFEGNGVWCLQLTVKWFRGKYTQTHTRIKRERERKITQISQDVNM